MKIKFMGAILILGLMFNLCSPVLAEKIQVAVSIPPQKYFLEKIGHPYLDVMIMVKPGDNPATYEPKPSQITALAHTQAYFAIGVPFEDIWLPKFKETNPHLTIIASHENIKKRFFKEKKASDISSRQIRKDPHIWLSPPLVRIIAGKILKACINMDKPHAPEYIHNYYQFCQEINKVDSKILQSLEKIERQSPSFMVYHPAWGYFARTYGLKQLTVEKKGKEPSPRQLCQLVDLAKKSNLKTIFVQPQFSEKSASTIAKDINGEVIPLDPLAENWAENLGNAAQKIINSLKQ